MKRLKAHTLLLLTIFLTAGLVVGASSQTADNVVVKVNGTNITEADMRFAEVELTAQLLRLPPDRRRQAILDYLIDGQLLAEAGQQAKLDRRPSFEARRQYHFRRALRDAYFDEQIRDQITTEELRRTYDAQVAALKPVIEYHVRQLLVGTESDARDLRLKLVSGSDFAALARQLSRDLGTAQNGGDMGYLAANQLDSDLAKAVELLQVGDLSPPIKTRVGWAIARVEDRRTRRPPSWDEVREVVRVELLAQRTHDVVAELRGRAAILYTNVEDEVGR